MISFNGCCKCNAQGLPGRNSGICRDEDWQSKCCSWELWDFWGVLRDFGNKATLFCCRQRAHGIPANALLKTTQTLPATPTQRANITLRCFAKLKNSVLLSGTLRRPPPALKNKNAPLARCVTFLNGGGRWIAFASLTHIASRCRTRWFASLLLRIITSAPLPPPRFKNKKRTLLRCVMFLKWWWKVDCPRCARAHRFALSNQVFRLPAALHNNVCRRYFLPL